MWRLFAAILLGLGVLCAQPEPARADPQEWQRALDLMRSGQTESALPLLERLVSGDSGNKHYRFELGLALFRLDRHFRAKWQLEQVRGAELTDNEAQLVNQVLSQIAAENPWSVSLAFALKSESNANQQTSDPTVNVGGLNFVLRPNARAKPSSSLVVTAGIGYAPRISERWSGAFSLSTYVKHNEDDNLRDIQLTARGGLRYHLDPRSSLAGGVLQGVRYVAGDPYSTSTGLWLGYDQLIGQRGKLEFGLEGSRIGYHGALPDGTRVLAQASYTHALTARARLTFGGYLEQTRGSLPNLTGDRAGIVTSGLYAWQGGLMTSLEVGYYTDRRRGPEPIFGVTRKDRKTSIALSVYHRDFRIGSFAPTLVMGAETNRSNIPLARFDNRYVTVGLTRNF